MLKAESEFQERELIKMEREREMAILRRQHEREIYMLKRKLHENTKMQVGGSPTATTGGSNSDPDSMVLQDGIVSVTIPTFTLSGIGSNSHVEYQVKLQICTTPMEPSINYVVSKSAIFSSFFIKWGLFSNRLWGYLPITFRDDIVYGRQFLGLKSADYN